MKHILSHVLPSGQNQMIGILVVTGLILLTIGPIYYSSLGHPTLVMKSFSQSSSHVDSVIENSTTAGLNSTCDIFTGEWVPDSNAPYYTNETCWAIHEHQNCMKYGRPDLEFMKWRWKPDDCELPIFDPTQFLDLVQGKSLAFVGDSVARNQMQSLICLLSRVEYPVEVSNSPDKQSTRWKYIVYNFTIEIFWSPYLVKSREIDSKGPTNNGLFNLYLDEFDESWTTKLEHFDYVIISCGHWFLRPLMYYENKQLVGCYSCLNKNITDLQMYYGYRRVFRTAFRAINSLKNFKGITFLRTFSPRHFENGEWNTGGDCVRKSPFKSNETRLDGINLGFHTIQREEFRIAKREGREKGLQFRLFDTTKVMLMRPDGHPSRYGHWPKENVTLYNDCIDWCLPGPIDTWSGFLLEMLKTEERHHSGDSKLKTR
ncbi:hypothetical protein ACHQM5_020055 [Ranunculus cassubicifolius]